MKWKDTQGGITRGDGDGEVISNEGGVGGDGHWEVIDGVGGESRDKVE
jgi:hypothetical protein